jgi:hypothetical protein
MGDALRILIDDRYGNLPDAGEGDGERMIERELIAMREEIRSISPEPAITDLFLLQSDVMNLKTLIKARLLEQKDIAWQAGGLYDRETLEKAVSEQDYSFLPEDMVKELNALEKRLSVSVEPQYISIALDRAYLRHALKATAKNLRIPVVLLCQLNREAAKQNRSPQLFNLRDSGSIEQDADVVLMLNQVPGPKGFDLEVIVRKDRQGENDFGILMRPSDNYMDFTEMGITKPQ